MKRLALGLVLALSALCTPSAQAAEGVRQINQTCAVETGCFEGDAPGFPVTVDGSAGRSYVLTSVLQVGAPETTAILISTDDVTVDLNGFAILGVSSCGGIPTTCSNASTSSPFGSGVLVDDTTLRAGTVVRNGVIANMGWSGVHLGPRSRVEHLRALGNARSGIFVEANSVVRRNVLRFNFNGIVARTGTTISENVVSHSASEGINGKLGMNVTENVSTASGNNGINVGHGSLIRGNAVHGSRGDGIDGDEGCSIVENVSLENGDASNDDGFECSTGCVLRANVAAGNTGHGLRLFDASAAYSHNVMTANAEAPVLGGFRVGLDNHCSGSGTLSSSCP